MRPESSMPEASRNILIVDDEETNRDVLDRVLRRIGHETSLCANGAQAIERSRTGRFDLVLLDVMMPEVDGFTVLSQLREQFEAFALPIIMVTARDASDDIVRALEAGANDYITKPIDPHVLRARVSTQLALREKHLSLERAHQRMSEELRAASQLQQALLPVESPEATHYRFAWNVFPCNELAGDTLNLFPMTSSIVGLYQIDVSGHGVRASLLSTTLSSVVTSAHGNDLLWKRAEDGTCEPAPPSAVASELNRRFQLTRRNPQYFTMAYALLDTAAHRMSICCAGHPPPIVIRNGKAVDPGIVPDMAIGWVPDAAYHDHFLGLPSGSRVHLISDGCIEQRNPGGRMFGFEQLIELCEHHAQKPLDEIHQIIYDALTMWAGRPLDDDASLMTVEAIR